MEAGPAAGEPEDDRGDAERLRRIFLAEDNEDLALLLTRKLTASRRWHVERARTKEEAATRLRGDRFDVVVLDYMLPGGSGLDLLPIVREASPETPILFLTAHGSEDVALKALGLGATDYMQKTGDLLLELPERLDQLLARAADVRVAARAVPAGPTVRRRSGSAESGGLLGADEAALAIRSVVSGETLGAAVFDGSGRPIAAVLPRGLDATVLGASLMQVHAQVGVVGRLNHLAPRAYRFILDTDAGTLAASTIPGRAIVAVLVKSRAGLDAAATRLDALVARLDESK